MEFKPVFILLILSALLFVGHSWPTYEDERERQLDAKLIEGEEGAEGEAAGAESGSSGAEPTTAPPAGGATTPAPAGGPPPAGGAPAAPGGAAPGGAAPGGAAPGTSPIPIVDAVNKACTDFQTCAAHEDPNMCLQQMLTALSSLAGTPGGGGAGGYPCAGGAGAAMPMPMPAPQPMPYPYPMPYPMPYPGEVITEPTSCGGTYPCKDKGGKNRKHRDSKAKKHHKSHKKD